MFATAPHELKDTPNLRTTKHGFDALDGNSARKRTARRAHGLLPTPNSQYGLRHVNGVPGWNEDIWTLRDHQRAALWYRAGLKPREQDRAMARLWAKLQGPAKEVVRVCKAQDIEDARGVERLRRIFREPSIAARIHRRLHRARAACLSRDDQTKVLCGSDTPRRNMEGTVGSVT